MADRRLGGQGIGPRMGQGCTFVGREAKRVGKLTYRLKGVAAIV